MESRLPPDLRTASPDSIYIVHNAEISSKWRCIACEAKSLCDLQELHWTFAKWLALAYCFGEYLNRRSYVQVQEHRIESNYPRPKCACECGGESSKSDPVEDDIQVIGYKDLEYVKVERGCSPYQCCSFQPCGEVVHVRKKGDGSCGCCCCNRYYPGLADAEALIAHIATARAAFDAGGRVVPHSSQMVRIEDDTFDVDLAAAKIQSVFRGGKVRDNITLKEKTFNSIVVDVKSELANGGKDVANKTSHELYMAARKGDIGEDEWHNFIKAELLGDVNVKTSSPSTHHSQMGLPQRRRTSRQLATSCNTEKKTTKSVTALKKKKTTTEKAVVPASFQRHFDSEQKRLEASGHSVRKNITSDVAYAKIIEEGVPQEEWGKNIRLQLVQ